MSVRKTVDNAWADVLKSVTALKNVYRIHEVPQKRPESVKPYASVMRSRRRRGPTQSQQGWEYRTFSIETQIVVSKSDPKRTDTIQDILDAIEDRFEASASFNTGGLGGLVFRASLEADAVLSQTAENDTSATVTVSVEVQYQRGAAA